MSTRRPWAAASAAALLAVLAGCGTSDDEQRGTDEPSASGSPAGTATASPSATGSATPEPTTDGTETAPATARAVPVYYVGRTPAGPRLFREFHRLQVPDSPAAVAKAAVVEAVRDSALDPDYRSPWAALGTTVGDVQVAGDTVVVELAGDLHDRPAGMSAAEASMAVEQLVHTAQAAVQRRAPVQLMLAGGRTDTLLGVPVSEPLAAGDPMEVEATVWVIDPQDGTTVASPFTVSGRGAFFEATVSWQLLRDGKVVKDGFATAKEGMTLSPYSFRVEAPPGRYVLRVYDADMSGGEGNGEMEDTKRITVR